MRFCNQCMQKLETDAICPNCGYDTRKIQDVPHALQPGTILNGKYLVGNILGQGGFGITYVGLDLALEVKVAIKEHYITGNASRSDPKSQKVYWTQNPGNMDHFITEARRMAMLEKMPEVAHVRDVFYANNTAYIIMEYVEGQTLKSYLQKNGPMSWEQTVNLMMPVITALGQVHDRGLIHRDIGPDNLMMQPDGTLRVLDLGAASDLRQNNGQASQLVARQGFSPYEQYVESGKIGPWTDVYAVCATLYYCHTGRLIPDAYTRVDHYMKTRDSRIAFAPSVSPKVAELLQKGLAMDVQNRIPNMRELAELLKRSLRKDSKPGTHIPAPPKQLKYLPLLLAVVAVVAAVSLIFGNKKDADNDEPVASTEQQESIAETVHEDVPETTVPEETADELTRLKESLSDAQPGDVITFGTYEQDNIPSNGKEDLEWIVLEKDGDRLFVITRYAIDNQIYHTKLLPVTWETCYLREWLNDTFLQTAFTPDQESLIPTVTVPAHSNPKHTRFPGNDTQDRVYILSTKEAEIYFPDQQSRYCQATAYALSRGNTYLNPDTGCVWWWLRTHGEMATDATSVNSNGRIGYSDALVTSNTGTIRPVMWIDIG